MFGLCCLQEIIYKYRECVFDLGGDVYVLTIQATTHHDSGLYICEVDTKPPTKSFHKLSGNIAKYPRLEIKD